MAQEMNQREILVAIRDDAEFSVGLRAWIERREALRADGADELDAADEESLIRLFRDARARIAMQDARQDSIEELIRQTIEQTAAIRADTAAMRLRMDKFDAQMAESDKRFAEFQARMDASDKRFAAFEARMDESDKRFIEFQARMDASDKRFAAFEARMDEHADYMRRVDQNQQRLGGRLGNMRGSDIEGELLVECEQIMAAAFGCDEIDILRSARGGAHGIVGGVGGFFEARMRNARRRGRISSDEYRSLRQADLVARGRFDGGKAPVWLVIEASGAIDIRDVGRARDRAAIFTNLENADAVGMVYGYHIPENVDSYAKECNVRVIIAQGP